MSSLRVPSKPFKTTFPHFITLNIVYIAILVQFYDVCVCVWGEGVLLFLRNAQITREMSGVCVCARKCMEYLYYMLVYVPHHLYMCMCYKERTRCIRRYSSQKTVFVYNLNFYLCSLELVAQLLYATRMA